MKLRKFINIISFNIFNSDLPLKQNPHFIYHADKLIQDNHYEQLLEMLDNDYLLTKEQNNIIATKIVNFIYEDQVQNKNADYSIEAKMFECFQKYGDKMIFSSCLNKYFKKSIHDLGNGNRYGPKENSFNLNYYKDKKFSSTFFYKLGINAFNQDMDTPTLKKEVNNNLLKNALQILIDTLSEIIDKSPINKQSSINYITNTTPIEFYPYIYKNVENLNKTNNKNSEISLYEQYEVQFIDIGKKLLSTQNERLDNLKNAYNYAQKFIFNNYEDKEDQNIDKHTTIINSLKQNNPNKISEADKKFELVDFSKIYNVSEISQNTLYILKNIQEKYKKLHGSDNLDIESSHQLSKTSSSVFKILDNYEITKDFLDSAAMDAEENLKVIYKLLSSIEVNKQFNIVNNLSTDNKKQQTKKGL